MESFWRNTIENEPAECKFLSVNLPKNVTFVFNQNNYWIVYLLQLIFLAVFGGSMFYIFKNKNRVSF
jgi:hypothetical protein